MATSSILSERTIKKKHLELSILPAASCDTAWLLEVLRGPQIRASSFARWILIIKNERPVILEPVLKECRNTCREFDAIYHRMECARLCTFSSNISAQKQHSLREHQTFKRSPFAKRRSAYRLWFVGQIGSVQDLLVHENHNLPK